MNVREALYCIQKCELGNVTHSAKIRRIVVLCNAGQVLQIGFLDLWHPSAITRTNSVPSDQ